MRYILDGSTPTAASSLYSSARTIATGTTLKAIAVKSDWTDSSIATAVYVFNYGTLATPTCHAWTEFWLNEGFATYMVAAYREHTLGKGAYLADISSMRERVDAVAARGNVDPSCFRHGSDRAQTTASSSTRRARSCCTNSAN